MQLLEDVNILAEQGKTGSRPTPSAARAVLAPILRRWICDQQFHRVQKLLRPHAVKFPIERMPIIEGQCKRGEIGHWMAPVTIDDLSITTALPSPEFIDQNGKWLLPADDAQTKPSDLPINALEAQNIFYWSNKFFTRRDVLTIHANKRGGVHLQSNFGAAEPEVEGLSHYFGCEIIGGNYQMLVGDDVRIAKTDPIRRVRTYDAIELFAIDTSRIFCAGVNAVRGRLDELILAAA